MLIKLHIVLKEILEPTTLLNTLHSKTIHPTTSIHYPDPQAFNLPGAGQGTTLFYL